MLARACVAWGCDVDDVRLAGLDISAVSAVWRRRAEVELIVGSSCIPVPCSFRYSGSVAVLCARPLSSVSGPVVLSLVASVLFGLMRRTELTDD
jgi:hypothetical protein